MDAKEIIRAAQALELQGDKPAAAAKLASAAKVYMKQGRNHRAVQLLRHAQRLAPDNADLSSALKIVESWGEPANGLVQAADAVMPEETPPPPRAITRADPTVAAQCSFCCRPDNEAGPLVAGPAAAFICGQCVMLATAELAAGPSEEGAPGVTEKVYLSASAVPAEVAATRVRSRIVGQDAAVRRLLDSVGFFWVQPANAPVRVLALVGPPSSGKSATLAAFAGPGPAKTRLVDAEAEDIASAAASLAGGPLLLLVDNGQAWRGDRNFRALHDGCRRHSGMAVVALTDRRPLAVEATIRAAAAGVISTPLYRLNGAVPSDGVDAVVAYGPLGREAIEALLDSPPSYFPELGSISPQWVVTQAARGALVERTLAAKSVEELRRALLAAGVAAAAGQARDEVVVDGVTLAEPKRRGKK